MAGATSQASGPGRDSAWVEHALVALGDAGYHRGGARLAVIELLARQDRTVTAIEIDDQLRATNQAIGRASVYRTLEQLEELQLVHRLEMGRGMASYSESSRAASTTTTSSARAAVEWSRSRTRGWSGRSGGWRTGSASRSPSTRSCSAAAALAARDADGEGSSGGAKQAAVERDHRPGEVGGALRAQEGDQVAVLLGLPEACRPGHPRGRRAPSPPTSPSWRPAGRSRSAPWRPCSR